MKKATKTPKKSPATHQPKKISKNTAKKEATKEIWVAVSGGFDPLHIGHVRMFQQAKKLGDKLVVIINNDNWLKDKKGYAFMPETERKEIISAYTFVDKVVLTDHKPGEYHTDKSVCRALRKLKPDIFANGGDRFADNIPEAILCKELGIKTKFNVGRGGKVQSSSDMANKAFEAVGKKKVLQNV